MRLCETRQFDAASINTAARETIARPMSRKLQCVTSMLRGCSPTNHSEGGFGGGGGAGGVLLLAWKQ